MVEEFIPTLDQLCLVFSNHLEQLVNFLSAEATAALKPYGFKPKFCDIIVTFNVDMARLAAIS
jgi:hypothetical protein